MDYNNFDNNTNNDKINPFIGDDKKSLKKSIILAISLLLVGFILVIVLAVSFAGEDGFIREDAPGEWLFVAIIPIILGMIILFISLFKFKKDFGPIQNPGRTSELSPKQALNSLSKGKFIMIIISVIFIGLLILLLILGKLSFVELIDAFF